MQGNLSSALSHSISTWNESLTNVIWTIKREENFPRFKNAGRRAGVQELRKKPSHPTT